MKEEETIEEIRVFEDVEPMEISVVGIGAYPTAVAELSIPEITLDEEVETVKERVTAMEKKRKQLGMSPEQFYAAPRNPPSESALPIFDEAHVRNAMARFNQTHFRSAEEKRKAYNKILRAAKKFGIDVRNFEKLKPKEFGGEKMEIKKEEAQPQELGPEQPEQKQEEEQNQQQQEPKKEEQEVKVEEKQEPEQKSVKIDLAEFKKEIVSEIAKQLVEELKSVKPENKGLVEKQVPAKDDIPDDWKNWDVETFEKKLRELVSKKEYNQFFVK